MKIVETQRFSKSVQKLNPNQKKLLDDAVKRLLKKTEIDQLKRGDLKEVRVFKFKMQHKEWLLAYKFDKSIHGTRH